MKKNYTIRKAILHDVAAIATVHARSWQETYCDLLPGKIIQNFSQIENLYDLWNKLLNAPEPHSACFVVELAHEVVGFIHCGECKKEKGIGEYFSFYVLAHVQRLGIGSALFGQATHFLALHFQKKILWVLQENIPARLFYEKHHGKATESLSFQLGEVIVKKIRYVWE